MARHYSDARKNAHRASETKRREISQGKREARRDKEARRQFESGPGL